MPPRSADPTAASIADTPRVTLRGMTWNHTRGYVSVVAAAQRFEELQPRVRITWDKRSLQKFADAPLDQLADAYDLLVIDHPWAGFAAQSGVLAAMDDLMPDGFMDDQAANSVGPSHGSYRFNGKSWALALDAATPVASWRHDLLQARSVDVPQTWEDVLALARQGLVAGPGIAQDTLMNFYAVCERPGTDLFASEESVVSEPHGVTALESLRELACLMPREHFNWNPIGVYEHMTGANDVAYCPWAYGYSNYSRRGYARAPLTFGDVVSFRGHPLRTTLGGTGVAISSSTAHLDLAARFAAFVADPGYQRTQYTENGGQPGHRAAWLDDENNRRTRDYFKNTLPCLDRAYLRPTYPGALAFQDRDGGGAPIRAYLMHGGDPKAVLDTLNRMYRESIANGRRA